MISADLLLRFTIELHAAPPNLVASTMLVSNVIRLLVCGDADSDGERDLVGLQISLVVSSSALGHAYIQAVNPWRATNAIPQDSLRQPHTAVRSAS